MAKRINKAQLTRIYWPEWRKADKVLQANHHTKEEAEAVRREIHVSVTGIDCSSKDLTNRQLDACLARFAAISSPGDGKRQADLAEAAAKRVRFKIRQIQERMQLPDTYIESLAQRMARRPLAQCDEKQLQTILKALNYHENRHSHQ